LYGQDKYDALESADVYVMPSFSEVFSLAVLDAMACAKPSVITSGCGYSYFIDKDFYVGCEPYSQDIAKGIDTILQRKADWKTMGNNARAFIDSELNWKSIAETMIKNYARIIRGEAYVD
jgi:glycosyltransferase involved in cell wall biosynthesis